LRRLVAFLIYQSVHLATAGSSKLRNAFLDNAGIAHGDLRSAVFRLSDRSPADLLGGHYKRLREASDQSYKIRQKLLHGQQSGQSLSRSDLLSFRGSTEYGNGANVCGIMEQVPQDSRRDADVAAIHRATIRGRGKVA
jgi:hypothetical protein